jgi:hypothetical protein
MRTFGLSLKQSQARAMSCFSRSVSSFLGSMLEELLELLCGIARVGASIPDQRGQGCGLSLEVQSCRR